MAAALVETVCGLAWLAETVHDAPWSAVFSNSIPLPVQEIVAMLPDTEMLNFGVAAAGTS